MLNVKRIAKFPPKDPKTLKHTVDGSNLAPPGMYKTLEIIGQATYQLVQDFFHQQQFQSALIYESFDHQKFQAPKMQVLNLKRLF